MTRLKVTIKFGVSEANDIMSLDRAAFEYPVIDKIRETIEQAKKFSLTVVVPLEIFELTDDYIVTFEKVPEIGV